eukprot:3592142-Amphidinium_carterae.1
MQFTQLTEVISEHSTDGLTNNTRNLSTLVLRGAITIARTQACSGFFESSTINDRRSGRQRMIYARTWVVECHDC